MDLHGTKLRLQHAKVEMWHLPPITTDTKLAAIEVPHIVDIEVNQIMRAAKLALHRAGRYKRSFPVSSAQVFDYGNPADVASMANVRPSNGHRYDGSRSLFSSDMESTDVDSGATDAVPESSGDQVANGSSTRSQ
jgi:hypothetical protein